MTIEEKLRYKKELHQYSVETIQQRINAALQAMQNAQDAANSEEKSSAGDKYETGRAMNHLEKDMHARQLAANKNELAALLAVDSNTVHPVVTTGSIICCDNFNFFIAAGLGKILFKNDTVYLLSPNAPVSKSLLNTVAGNSFSFNNNAFIINEVF